MRAGIAPIAAQGSILIVCVHVALLLLPEINSCASIFSTIETFQE